MKGKLQLGFVTLILSAAVAFAGEPENTPTSHCTTLFGWHFNTTTWSHQSIWRKRNGTLKRLKAPTSSIRNESSFIHLTDTQLVEIGAGTLGTVAGSPIPTQSAP